VSLSIDRAVGVGGVTVGLIGSGIVVLWPDKRWLGWVLIGLGLLIAAFAVVWALARWQARKEFERELPIASISPVRQQLNQTASPHNEQRNEFSPKIEIHQNQAQVQPTVEPRSFSEPHIEFTNPLIAPRTIDAWGRLQVANGPPTVDVMLARFYFKPERSVPPYLFLKAHLSIADEEHVPIKARYDGTWDGHSDSSFIRLGTAQTGVLVVALLPPANHNEGESILTWGFEGLSADGGFASDNAMLRGREFFLTIELVGKYQSDVVLHESLNFSLNVNRRSMALIS
jgi:hypothetical protein